MYADMLKEELRKGEELEMEQEEERCKQVLQYQNELEDQLREQEQKRVELYQEFLKEKLMIDEICRRIYEEDQREQEARLEKQKATREYIEDFKRKREEVCVHVLYVCMCLFVCVCVHVLYVFVCLCVHFVFYHHNN